jgi:hypothetical protein
MNPRAKEKQAQTEVQSLASVRLTSQLLYQALVTTVFLLRPQFHFS